MIRKHAEVHIMMSWKNWTNTVVRSTLVQDGVERLQIVAGNAALSYGRKQDQLIRDSSSTFGVSEKDLPKTSSRFFEEWKLQRKKIEQLEAEIIRLRTSGRWR